MGSGREEGFNPAPDWSVYALLGVWEEEVALEAFLAEAEIYRKYQANSEEQCTIFLRTIHSKGAWSGGNPFESSQDLDPSIPYIGVITRATIKWSQMYRFWSYVPTSQRPIQQGCPGLIYTKGIGEAPLVQMATFSLWENFEAVKNFAYNSKEHRVAIEKTRKHNWYKEELFARFQPYKVVGQWGGQELLPNLP